MSDLPFTVSPEASAYIEESLRDGDASPDCAGLVAALCQTFNSGGWDADGNVIERFEGESWCIGYHDLKEIEGEDFVAVELGGRSLLIHADSLRDLTGKRLMIQLVGVGVPNPADKMERMLRAVCNET